MIYAIRVIFFLLLANNMSAQSDIYLNAAFNLIHAIAQGEPYEIHLDQLKDSSVEELEEELDSDDKKYAFRINVYNAFIQIELRREPSLYDERNKFFNREVINVGGRKLSFSNLEQGIIRRSEWLIGLGYLKNPFPNSFKKRMRPKKSEWRIHFALNFGAKSCPPVAVYDYKRLDEQLQLATERYIPNYTRFDESNNKVITTPLFSWFRGDFGGNKGVKKILNELQLIHSTDVKLSFNSYDWSLYMDNFIEL